MLNLPFFSLYKGVRLSVLENGDIKLLLKLAFTGAKHSIQRQCETRYEKELNANIRLG